MFQSVLLTGVVVYDPVDYNGEELSTVGRGLAWTIAGLGVIVVPVYAAIAVCKAEGTIREVTIRH